MVTDSRDLRAQQSNLFQIKYDHSTQIAKESAQERIYTFFLFKRSSHETSWRMLFKNVLMKVQHTVIGLSTNPAPLINSKFFKFRIYGPKASLYL